MKWLGTARVPCGRMLEVRWEGDVQVGSDVDGFVLGQGYRCMELHWATESRLVWIEVVDKSDS